jgi:general nucleoside transport system ATP-binding protein
MMLLEMKNIHKSFPGVRANCGINFDVAEGEIHTLLGENGAGKSTLMNILYGLYVPDEGEIYWQGKKTETSNTSEALEMGIGMIHQHFMLIPKFTVVENIVLGTWEGSNPKLEVNEAAKKISQLSQEYGLKVDPWALVEDLSVGEQQRVEIIKALYRGAKLLIMDEPTAVLTPGEVEDLFTVLFHLKEENRSIIFISHKLEEVRRISDRITVLRDGCLVSTVDNSPDLDRGQLAHMMVGREISLDIEKPPVEKGDVVLSLKSLHTESEEDQVGLQDISFDVHRGEIFCIAGVDGNGQDELAEAIMGLLKLKSGQIMILGQETTRWKTGELRKLPLAYIPKDRHNVGLVMDFSVGENCVLDRVERKPYGRPWFLSLKAIQENARELIKRFNVYTPDTNTEAGKLSGGNQQKVVLARETGQPVDIVIAVQPTRGLDVDATRFVFDTMLAAREQGAGILYITTELDEIMGLSDTIGVLFEGELIGTLPGAGAELQTVGLLMAGERVNAGEGRDV